MRAGRTFLFAGAVTALGGAALGFVLLRNPPAPVFDDLLRIAPPVEEQASVATRPVTPDVPVALEGRTLKAGRVSVDLERPAEELRRLVLRFRAVHAEFRKDRRDPERRLEISELGNALGQLLRARPELGPAYYHAVLEEPHRDAIRDLAPMLELCGSPGLQASMIDVLETGGPVMPRYLAATNLGRCAEPRALAALLGAWPAEADALLRTRLLASIIANLASRPPGEPDRERAFEGLRRIAREDVDAARRAESVGILVEAQDGLLSAADRALVRSTAEAEKDPVWRGRLDVIVGKLRP